MPSPELNSGLRFTLSPSLSLCKSVHSAHSIGIQVLFWTYTCMLYIITFDTVPRFSTFGSYNGEQSVWFFPNHEPILLGCFLAGLCTWKLSWRWNEIWWNDELQCRVKAIIGWSPGSHDDLKWCPFPLWEVLFWRGFQPFITLQRGRTPL